MKQKFIKSNNHRIPHLIVCRHSDDERVINYEWPQGTYEPLLDLPISFFLEKRIGKRTGETKAGERRMGGTQS